MLKGKGEDNVTGEEANRNKEASRQKKSAQLLLGVLRIS